MSRRGDEVEAAVDTGIGDALLPGDVHLLFEELFVLLIDVFLNGLPATGQEEKKKKDGVMVCICLTQGVALLGVALLK